MVRFARLALLLTCVLPRVFATPAAAMDVPITDGQIRIAMKYGSTHDYATILTSGEWNKRPVRGPQHLALQIFSPFLLAALCPADYHTTGNDPRCVTFSRAHASLVKLSLAFESRSAADNTSPHIAIMQHAQSTACHALGIFASTDSVNRIVRLFSCDFTARDHIDWSQTFDVVVTHFSDEGYHTALYHLNGADIR